MCGYSVNMAFFPSIHGFVAELSGGIIDAILVQLKKNTYRIRAGNPELKVAVGRSRKLDDVN